MEVHHPHSRYGNRGCLILGVQTFSSLIMDELIFVANEWARSCPKAASFTLFSIEPTQDGGRAMAKYYSTTSDGDHLVQAKMAYPLKKETS